MNRRIFRTEPLERFFRSLAMAKGKAGALKYAVGSQFMRIVSWRVRK
jgi:hypothetical protein